MNLIKKWKCGIHTLPIIFFLVLALSSRGQECQLFYQPVIEVRNLDDKDYTGVQVFYVIDREKYMPLNREMNLDAGEQILLQLPPLLASSGMHILELYLSGDGLDEKSHQIQIIFRDAALVGEMDNIIPLEAPDQGEPVLDAGTQSADQTDQSRQSAQCACLSNVDGKRPLSSLWYTYTKNASGDGLIYTSIQNGSDWTQAVRSPFESASDCFQYESKMSVVSTEYDAKVYFIPESELKQAAGVIEEEVPPVDDLLAQDNFMVYPNPVREQTTIAFKLEEDGPIKIEVFDYNGLKLMTLINSENHRAGRHEIQLQPLAWPNGLYFCRMESATEEATAKFILVR